MSKLSYVLASLERLNVTLKGDRPHAGDEEEQLTDPAGRGGFELGSHSHEIQSRDLKLSTMSDPGKGCYANVQFSRLFYSFSCSKGRTSAARFDPGTRQTVLGTPVGLECSIDGSVILLLPDAVLFLSAHAEV